MTDCAGFENGLVELLADGVSADERRRLAARLSAHAEACVHCRGSLGLLRELALPADRRDPLPDPGAVYWRSFERRLAGRIAAERVTAGGRRGRLAGAAALAAAAVAALVLALPWISPDRTGVLPPAGPRAEAGIDSLEEPLTLPPELDRKLRGRTARALWSAGDLVAPAAAAEEEAGWVPAEVYELDETQRRELLEWLREQNAATEGETA